MHRPRLFFDHVLIAIPDLDASLRAFEAHHGLAAKPGGRHPGVGTANAIVSLGGDQYLELITVVDREEAEREPLRNRVVRSLDRGQRFAGWALRTDDIDALGDSVQIAGRGEGARDRPDGVRLAWRMAVPAGSGSGIPFFIQWTSGEHPGAAGPRRPVRRVTVQDAGNAVASLLERVELDVQVDVQTGDGDEPRLLAVELDGLTVS